MLLNYNKNVNFNAINKNINLKFYYLTFENIRFLLLQNQQQRLPKPIKRKCISGTGMFLLQTTYLVDIFLSSCS